MRRHVYYLHGFEETLSVNRRQGSDRKKSWRSIYIFDKYGSGKNLMLVRNRLIVQSWRSADWNEDDVDSIFTLYFVQRGRDVIVEMTHANIPDQAYAGIKSGWNQYYWEPWRKYLKMRLEV